MKQKQALLFQVINLLTSWMFSLILTTTVLELSLFADIRSVVIIFNQMEYFPIQKGNPHSHQVINSDIYNIFPTSC